MADVQPPTVVEGATTGDVEDEIPQAAKSAEERKAAAALSSLDASREDDTVSAKNVDQEAVKKAMDRLAGNTAAAGEVKKKEDAKKEVKKAIKVDQADVTLLVGPPNAFDASD
jgi:phenylalanyl-tRNA synthetase beta subunit